MTEEKIEAAPADAGKPAETLVTASADTTATTNNKPWYPDDWNAKLAGQDEKAKNVLSKFKTPEDLAKSYLEINKKISAGELRSGLKENATPEEVATWRKLNGVPETPEGYDLAFDNGLVIGEEDKPIVGEFLGEMHKSNAHPATVKAAINAYYQLMEKQNAARMEADTNYKSEAENTLKSEWGADYTANVNLVKSLMAGAPDEVRDSLLTARLADGTVLGNNPAVLKYLNGLAKQIMPQGTITSATGSAGVNGLVERMAEIEKMMGDKSSDYWKGSRSELLQKEYRELVEKKNKLK